MDIEKKSMGCIFLLPDDTCTRYQTWYYQVHPQFKMYKQLVKKNIYKKSRDACPHPSTNCFNSHIVVLNKMKLLTRKDTDHVFSIELFTKKTHRAGVYTFYTFVFVLTIMVSPQVLGKFLGAPCAGSYNA